MAIANVQSRSATGSGTSLALAYLTNPVSGNLLTAGVGCGDDGDNLTDVTDNNSNTWSQANSATAGSQVHSAIWYAANSNAGATTVTANFSTSTFHSAICIAEYSGIATSSPLDQSNTGTGFTQSLTTSSITTTVADELIVAVCVAGDQAAFATWTLDADFDAERADTGAARPFQYIDDIVTATATIDSTHAHNAGFNANCAAVIASFKIAPLTYEQEGFRWREDDGSESAASWIATQDTNITRAKGTNTRLRVLVDSANGDPPSNTFQLEVKRSVYDDSAYKAVNSSTGPIRLSASANIAASGEATTAQLTAPASGAFRAGRIQDDENPADAVDLATNEYTELEWCLTAIAGTGAEDAQNTFIYQFRVTRNGTPLDTYTVTPQWTISGDRHLFGATH